jgi:hypothetical protein
VGYFVALTESWFSLQVPHLGLDAAREAVKKTVQEIEFKPTNTELTEPKEGKHDDKEHSGGNTYAGGVGGSIIQRIGLVLTLTEDGWA